MAKRKTPEPGERQAHEPIVTPVIAQKQIERTAQIQADWQKSNRPIQRSRDNR